MDTVNHDLTKILVSKYANKWIALNQKQTKVIAFGKSPKMVLALAKKKKAKKPVITLVANDYGFLVP